MIKTARDFTLTPRAGAKRGNLYKPNAGSVIYCRFFYSRHGKKIEVKRSTGMTSEREARARAWAIWQHETGRAPTGPEKRRTTSPKLGRITDYITEHRKECTGASPSALKSYVQALGRAVNIVCGTEGDEWRELNLSVLSDDFVHRWRRAKYAAKGLDIDEPDDMDLFYNWSLNSEMQSVRSLFGKQALHAYADAGMEMPPQLARFLSCRRMPAEERGFTPIPEQKDRRMRAQVAAALLWPSIRYSDGSENPVSATIGVADRPSAAVAVVYEMARFCGLTQKEIVNFQTAWLVAENSAIDIAPFKDTEGRNWQTKRNSKNGRVPVSPARVRRWKRALEGMDTEPGYFLPGTCKTHREDLCRREANKWIAAYLPDRTKRLHELRKQSGSDVFHKHGLSAAAAFIRDSEATARKFYLPRGHDSSALGVAAL